MNNKKSQLEIVLIDKNKRGKIIDWRGKKFSSLSLARIYKRIGEKLKDEYKKRGVAPRYKYVTRKVIDGSGIKVSEIRTQSKGLYDSNGKRVVNYEGRAESIKYCGSYLSFAYYNDTSMKLINANFCRVPLCPMCQWRKSLRIFFDVSRIMEMVEERHSDYKALFLTLTVRNCGVDDLKNTLDSIFKGWVRFMNSRTLRPEKNGEQKHTIIKGWFRALEVTYDSDEIITPQRYKKAKNYYDERGLSPGDMNFNYNTFHPHFHAIMLVDKKYFTGADYMKTTEWVQLWRQAAKLDYDPSCYISKTKNKKGMRKEVAEVAKYTYKDAEILNKKLSDLTKDNVIKNLSTAFHGRRLYAYGGIMKDIADELNIKDVDKSDLIKVDGNNINSGVAEMILTYGWHVGLSNYTLLKTEKNNMSDKRETNSQ